MKSICFFLNLLLTDEIGAESAEWAVIVGLLFLMAVIIFGSGNGSIHAAISTIAGQITSAING